ncbi:hypothetical protein LCGC14_3078110, partial [marine sediment metagenome]
MQLPIIDWSIILIYLVFSLFLGV